jgi:hypothetical protein
MSRAADLFAYLNLPPPAGERYASDVAIGRRGDAIGNRAADITATLRRRVREAEPVTLALDPESPGSKALVRFAAWTRGHGVKLVATWPNIRRFDAYQSPVADRFFSDVRQFYRKLAVPVIGSPHDAMFEADAFYDMIYHLHRSAVERRTTRLLPHLLDQLGSGSGVSGPLSGSVGSAT